MSIEILFSYEKDRIRRPEDAVVCCLHSYMTVSGYKCIGSGDKVNSHVLLTLILCYSILSYAGRSDLAVVCLTAV